VLHLSPLLKPHDHSSYMCEKVHVVIILVHSASINQGKGPFPPLHQTCNPPGLNYCWFSFPYYHVTMGNTVTPSLFLPVPNVCAFSMSPTLHPGTSAGLPLCFDFNANGAVQGNCGHTSSEYLPCDEQYVWYSPSLMCMPACMYAIFLQRCYVWAASLSVGNVHWDL
jgi:hypothetical protein